MNLPKHQTGASMFGVVILILVFGSIFTVAAKLVPLYMDHNTMSNLMDKMASEDGMANKTNRDITSSMQKRFKLNNIRDFKVKENVEIERTANGTKVVLDYEIRIPVAHNIDIIASFNKEVELRK